MLWHPRKQFLYPPGMESCLKKLGLDAPETGFQDAERAERKPLVPPGRELVPGGIHWRQMGVDSLPSGVQKVYSSLIGVRPDGAAVPVPGMSTGTADQLYLALRIASVTDYLDRAPPLPFAADDLFINFDAERAAAGFRVLG